MSLLPVKTVVTPVDAADPSYDGLKVALEFTESRQDVHVVYVLPRIEPLEPGVVWEAFDEESRIKRATRALAAHVNKENFTGVTLHVLIGVPHRQISELCTQVEANLVVLPSHGRTGFSRFFLGSVAEQVTRYAPCPVLVLRR